MSKFVIRNKTDLLRKAKDIHIPCHGTVAITLMAKCFIDNKYFQRLYKLKQLGACSFVFPGAQHTRGEHSIGTYYLADRIINRIKVTTEEYKLIEWLNECPELKLHYESQEFPLGFNNWVMELVRVAALCHDIGHGPYSHMFDNLFIEQSEYKDHPMATHEARSCAIIELIVKDSELLSKYISPDDIKFMQSLIDPGPNCEGFIYEIVSNNRNGVDVDKCDYILRDTLHTGIKNGFDHARLIDSVLVIDNKITYSEQAEQDIYDLYKKRHHLHRVLYGHKNVISAQYIINGIMKIIDKILNISSSITDFNKFVILTDEYVIQSMNFILEMRISNPDSFQGKLSAKDYNDLEELQTRLHDHNLYPHIGTMLSRDAKHNLEDIKDIFSANFKNDEYYVYCNKIGFVSGNKLNPLDNIYVYKTKELFLNGSDVTAHRIKKNDISCVISDIYQEYITMIFRKDNDISKMADDRKKFDAIVEMIKS